MKCKISNSFSASFPCMTDGCWSIKWSYILCSWGPTNLSALLPIHPSGPPSLPEMLSIGVVLEWSIIIAQGNGPSWETFRELSREKINAWPGSPGDWDPPSLTFLSSLPIFSSTSFLLPSHHPLSANNGMSLANQRFNSRIALNVIQIIILFSC